MGFSKRISRTELNWTGLFSCDIKEHGSSTEGGVEAQFDLIWRSRGEPRRERERTLHIIMLCRACLLVETVWRMPRMAGGVAAPFTVTVFIRNTLRHCRVAAGLIISPPLVSVSELAQVRTFFFCVCVCPYADMALYYMHTKWNCAKLTHASITIIKKGTEDLD